MRAVTVVADEGRVPLLPILSLDPVVRFLAIILLSIASGLLSVPGLAASHDGLIDGDWVSPTSYCDLPDFSGPGAAEEYGVGVSSVGM